MLASKVTAFRLLMKGVSGFAAGDLALLWAAWPWQDPRALTGLAVEQIPDLVQVWADVASGLAADQYDIWRVDEKVRGRAFRARGVQPPPLEQIVAGVRNGVSPLWAAVPDVASAQSLLAGMVIRHVMNGSTDTIVESTRRDPEAVGWARFTQPAATKKGPCGYCLMFADRGAVYRTEDTATFKSHDFCSCIAAPSWDPNAVRPVQEQLRATRYDQTDEDRERVKAWIAGRFPGA